MPRSKDRKEYENHEEILKQRSKYVIELFEKLVSLGCPPQEILRLEEENPGRIRDFALVLLGIKPVASYMGKLQDIFYPRSRKWQLGYTFFAPGNLTVSSDDESGLIWGIETVRSLLDQEQDALRKNREVIENRHVPKNESIIRFVFFANPSERRFDRSIKSLNYNNLLELDGILHGFDRESSRAFEQYHESMVVEAARLWQLAADSGMEHSLPIPHSPLTVQQNRAEFLQLASVLGVQDEGLVHYIATMRNANVPGYRYTTYGEVSLEHERKVNGLYQQSNFENIYEDFIASLRNR